MPEQAEHRDQERVRDQDGRQDAECRPDPELRHEVEPEEGETRDRDRNRQAGEEHGPAGGRTCLGCRVDWGEPFVQRLSEAGDDEQRVVDADTEPDHRDEQRRNRVDLGQAGQDEQEQERRHQRHQRQRDRDEHRHERAEDDEQHDQRREQAEQFLRALLDRRELGVAVVLDCDADRLDRLADRILHSEHRFTVGVEDDPVELRLGICNPAVVRERVLFEGVADLGDTRLVLGRCELVRLELRDRVLDRLAALGRVEPLAGGRGEDEIQDTALLLRELRLDQVGRLLRVRPGDLELVLQAAADGGDEGDQDGDDADPGEDDSPGMSGARARPAREPSGRETFVGSTPFRCRSLRHCGGSFSWGRLHVRRASTPQFIVHRFFTRCGTPSRYSTTTLTPSSLARSGSSRATRNAAGGADVA